MDELVVVFIAGFAASLVDGALGMGFGPTSSSILLGTGLSPAAVSTTVNLAKVATGITAAVAHWRFENVHRRLVWQLAVPGCIGALVGVTVLANVDGDTLKPVLSVLLLVMAARILFRFSHPLPVASPDDGSGQVRTARTRRTSARRRRLLPPPAVSPTASSVPGARWSPRSSFSAGSPRGSRSDRSTPPRSSSPSWRLARS